MCKKHFVTIKVLIKAQKCYISKSYAKAKKAIDRIFEKYLKRKNNLHIQVVFLFLLQF